MTIHHVELWVPDLARAERSWAWLLGELGYELYQHWERGRSWRFGPTYLVIEQSPDMVPGALHSRLRPGLNHLAFHAGSPEQVDDIVARAPDFGWSPLFGERYPHASGPDVYAAYLEDGDGFEVEIVADGTSG
jgi:catechol 2,3-dioxygenase-like lactoylglutathione lyase family enzyme